MASPSPWQLVQPRKTRVRKTYVYVRDPYYFSWESVTHGTNPAVQISATGPGSAGATFPTNIRQVEEIAVTVVGTLTTEQTYGNVLGEPAYPPV